MAIHHGLHEDETSGNCIWHLNAAHELEAWGDARAFDGTVLHHPAADRAALWRQDGPAEVLAAVAGKPDSACYDLVPRDLVGRA